MNKKKRDTLYSVWTILILFSVLLVLFALLFASFSKDYSPRTGKSAKSAATAAVSAPAASDAGVQQLTTSAALPKSADAGEAYIDRITFLSDATTLGIKTNGLLKDRTETTKVISTSDGTLSLVGISSAVVSWGGESVPITDAIKAAKPDILVITLGESGAAIMGQSYFTSEYTNLIKSIKEACPDTIIICNSILPVSQSYASANSMNADTIRQANNWIQQLASDNGCKYADSYSALAGEDGFLPSNYDSGDGLRPNSNGLNAMLTYLRTHAVT
jgi:lysophospholipase L1-like esterase